MPLQRSPGPAARAHPVARPRLTPRGVAGAALAWAAYSAVYALFIARGSDYGYAELLLGQLATSLFLALYSLPVWLLVVRGLDARGWGVRLAAHVVIAPLYAAAGMATVLVLTAPHVPPAVMDEIRGNRAWIAFGYLAVYAVQFAVYHLVRAAQRAREQDRLAVELEARARRQELAVLKAQLNPHFLFNTLNSISATIPRDPEGAREMVARLGELLRYAMRTPEQERVPLDDELQFARTYLELERRRFSDRLRVRYEVDPAALDALVPPMVLHPLVENAVRHGIAPSETGGEVCIRIWREGARVNVSVEDTGSGSGGSPAGAGQGIGLGNTDARLRGLFGPGAGLRVEPDAPRGFRVGFSLPGAPALEAR